MTYTVVVVVMILIHAVKVSLIFVFRVLNGVSFSLAREGPPDGMNTLKPIEMTLYFVTIYKYNVGAP